MPNWVYNHLTVEGDTNTVKQLVTQMNKSFTMPVEVHNMGDINAHGYPTKFKTVTYTKPVFAFWNIVSPYDQGITDEEYAQQPMRSELDVKDKNWWADNLRLQAIDKSWYSWNIHNWGCKWDVAVSDDEEYPETEMTMDSGDTVGYRFNTPWGIPDEALVKLSSQYPNLELTLSYEEETGWGGERTYVNGEVVDNSDYGWKCRECDHEEEETPYCETCDYDMCPSCGWGEPMDQDRAECEEHRETINA